MSEHITIGSILTMAAAALCGCPPSGDSAGGGGAPCSTPAQEEPRGAGGAPACPTVCPELPLYGWDGGCDMDIACRWITCDDPPRSCTLSKDCWATGIDDGVRCVPFVCGGVCAWPLKTP